MKKRIIHSVLLLFAVVSCFGQTTVMRFNLKLGQTIHAVLRKGERHVYAIKLQPRQTALLRTEEGGANGANIECIWDTAFVVRSHIKKWGRQSLLVFNLGSGDTKEVTVQVDRNDKAYGDYSIHFEDVRTVSEQDLLDDGVNGLYSLVTETARYANPDSLRRADTMIADLAFGVHDPVIKGNICLLLAEVFLDEHNQDAAIQELDTAMEIFEALGYRYQVAQCLHDLGDCAYRFGDKNTDIRLESKAEKIYDSLGDREMAAESLNNIGLSYGVLDDSARCRYYYNKALQTLPDDKSELAGTIYNNIALLFTVRRKSDSAIYYYRKAAPLRQSKYSKSGRAQSLSNLALEYSMNGPYNSAVTAIKEAIEIADNEKDLENRILYRSQLAQIYYYDLGKKDQGKQLFEEALSLSSAESSSTNEVHHQLGHIWMAEKNWREALYHLHFTARLRDRLWNLNLANMSAKVYGENRLEPYYGQIRCYMELFKEEKEPRWSDSARMVAIAIKGRSFVLEQRLNALPRNDRESRMLKYVSDTIAQSYSFGGARADLSDLYLGLLEGYSLALADKFSANALPVEDGAVGEVVEVQPDNSVLFLLNDEQSYAWVRAGEISYSYLLPGRAFFEEQVAKINAGVQLYYDLRTWGKKEVVGTILKEINILSDTIRPVLSHLAGPGVYVCRDGSLSLLPLQLINLDTSGGYHPAIERYEFSYLPSFQFYQEVASKQDTYSKDSLLVVADPIYECRDKAILPRLVNSGAEAMKIQRYFGHADILKAGDATKGRLVAAPLGTYNYIHFATHSVYDLNIPDLSNIVLSCTDSAGLACNPLLFTFEIETLHLHPRVVVLSSCYSGFGKAFTTEGVLSLERAFLVAGASSVISANWSADDKFSADFFSSMYDYHLNGNFPVAHALRLAQLDSWKLEGIGGLLNWAAFTYTGVAR